MLTVGVNVRGPARSTPEVYRMEWELARDLDLIIAMHCAGTRKEVARIHQVDVLNADGLLGPDVLLAHCLYISEDERMLCAEHGVPITMSPLSELRLAMGSPPILDHLDAGVSVSLSLDTTAISANADVFQAMRISVGLEAVRRQDAQALAPHRAIELNTIAGAEALGLGAVTGSLTVGKRADLILIRADDPNMAPVVDPAYAVVHSAQPSNVDTVVVDGRIIKRAGRLAGVDEAEIVEVANESLRNLCARAGFEIPWLDGGI
jgi:cytosine/adenosine deaminase-related metal-dependent hydrolase